MGIQSIIFMCCVLSITTYGTSEAIPSKVVKTNHGNVQGQTKHMDDGSVFDEFLGIPFGAPPLGENRFRKTKPPAPWNDTLQTVEYANACVQIIYKEGSEDCLYLNVVVPGGVDVERDPLPVMVWSYGGGYFVGAADQYQGHSLAVNAKVIVVTYNYRVGPLGGLSTGDEWSPGNYHLWDGHTVYTWVKDNIRAFGGDPNRVTAIGQSAGGATTSHFLTSPKMRGLVHRVISMSGGATSMFGTAYKNTRIAGNLAIASLCPTSGNKEMVECLREKDAKLVDTNGLIAGIVMGRQMPAWIPVVDGDFVPQHPKEALEDGVGGDIDFMAGSTYHDAAGIIFLNPIGLPGMDFNFADDPAKLDGLLSYWLRPFGDPKKQLDIIKEQYPEMESENVLVRTKAATQVLTDWLFSSPTYLEASLHARNAAKTGKNTYHYNFHYRQSFVHYEDWVKGSHLDDIWSLYGEEYNHVLRENVLGNFSDADKLVSEYITSYYGNFAYTGNPNKGPHKVPTFWPKFNATAGLYMEQKQIMEVKAVSAVQKQNYAFWTETWPNITYPATDDQSSSDENRMGWSGITEIISHLINHAIRYRENFPDVLKLFT